ncbi:hypothetical protein [Porphyromonas circumdentaria]|uniref:DUF4136 domain-containing protein n=1 Tax=Porphyromonas circumdentaria TaxID=29524 RepID=A0A1T4PVT7_9PORP|nr:hypothetical protein [Porphyromonas circumdentaria]MBB6276569.1 hypothetical protein [Porphyromonas circumdentaria]MDO4722374.1 hypothetical protein [Porphyromonas circumdentaria]SJZ95407.1 hypothetical protein SAMN02745171_01595 [Porphyromonas circumdentaria]
MRIRLGFLVFFGLLSLSLLTSCVTLRPASVDLRKPIDTYTYVYVPVAQAINSTTSATFSGVSQSVNSRDMIVGVFAKHGYVVLHQLEDKYLPKTLIVNCGESGRRNVFLGYTTEVTLQFISAETGELLCTTTAEGYISTENTKVKHAISRALEAVFSHQ